MTSLISDPPDGSTFGRLASALGYSDLDGLVTDDVAQLSSMRGYLYRRARDQVCVDAVFFVNDTPVAYFIRRGQFDAEEICELQRHVWNDARVPLLFVVTRTDVRLYDGFAVPTDDPGQLNHKTRLVRHLSAAADLLEELGDYHRLRIESGIAWSQSQGHFQRRTRCDETLLRNLRETRDRLQRLELPHHIIHKLLTRLILLFYLEHRKVLQPEYYRRFLPEARSLTDVLRSLEATYRLFGALAERFNGDLLPVDDEELMKVQERHIELLRALFLGTDITRGQRSLWPLYDFSIIPVQLVSAIYEAFFRPQASSKSGTYYTPLSLVELLMNEVLPWPGSQRDGISERPRVLDPACGSGIFLVEAYRRIVGRWRAQHPDEKVTPDLLCSLMEDCIYGVDTDSGAIFVAAFSLYLAMLEDIEPKSIWEQVRFPRLIASSDSAKPCLQVTDAFDPGAAIHRMEFDIVIGNPPWKRAYQPASRKYCEQREHPIAEESALPFLWLALDLCPDGVAALLCPSKWLFNRESTDRTFRREFFERAYVETVINLSAMRKQDLFAGATAPASAVVFRTTRPQNPTPSVLYCTPKPGHARVTPLDLFIDATDLKWLPREEAEGRDDLWKALLWGSWRDLDLIRRLVSRSDTTIRDFVRDRRDAGWSSGRGFQPFNAEKNRRKKRPTEPKRSVELQCLPFLDARKASRYAVEAAAFAPSFCTSEFSWTGPEGIYQGPHVLIKEGQTNGRFCAVFVPLSCSFRDTMTGISAPAEHAPELKALTVYLNSAVASYYFFLTVSTWGVERERVKMREALSLPSAFLDDSGAVRSLARLYDEWIDARESERPAVEDRMDQKVGGLLGLSLGDLDLIRDMLDTTIDHFQRGTRSSATDPPARSHLKEYVSAYRETMKPLLMHRGKSIRAEVHVAEGEPLCVVSLAVVQSSEFGIVVADDPQELKDVLRRLNCLLVRRDSPLVRVRRNLKIFDGNILYIVKPSERRFWTRSSAYQDADETITEAFPEDL